MSQPLHPSKSSIAKKNKTVNYFFNEEVTDSEDEDKTSVKKDNQELNIPEYDVLVKMKHNWNC